MVWETGLKRLPKNTFFLFIQLRDTLYHTKIAMCTLYARLLNSILLQIFFSLFFFQFFLRLQFKLNVSPVCSTSVRFCVGGNKPHWMVTMSSDYLCEPTVNCEMLKRSNCNVTGEYVIKKYKKEKKKERKTERSAFIRCAQRRFINRARLFSLFFYISLSFVSYVSHGWFYWMQWHTMQFIHNRIAFCSVAAPQSQSQSQQNAHSHKISIANIPNWIRRDCQPQSKLTTKCWYSLEWVRPI